LRHLPPTYERFDLLIDRAGIWHLGGAPIEPANLSGRIDVVFNCLHGEYGEDGQLQHLLNQLRLPYTGSGRIASALGMNKMASKEIARRHGLKVAEGLLVSAEDDVARAGREVFQRFGPPYVVKPADRGSSVGVSLVRQAPDLATAIITARQTSPTVLVEKYIAGREATCGVVEHLRGHNRYALTPIEILPPPAHAFYDYQAKYAAPTRFHCPGKFSEPEKTELARLATLMHDQLGLSHYSRSDFIVSPRGIYFLETNSLPGLTDQSLLPKSLAAVGIAYPDFLEHLIGLALEDGARQA
jgi:D-alanine-D-alanine ligase